jgi:hypothetical protein
MPVVATSRQSDTPEVSGSDRRSLYGPDGNPAPFAAVVIGGIPTSRCADLDRPGLFRADLAIGRDVVAPWLGFPPAAFADRVAGFDLTVLDRVIPHPARTGAVSILAPDARAGDRRPQPIGHAYRPARDRHPPGHRPS